MSELRTEVKSEIHGLKSEIHEVKSEIHGLKSEIHEVKSEIHGLKSEIHDVKSEGQSTKAAIYSLKAEMHRVALLVEEQNAKNNIVLDGLTSLFHRQERVESEVKDLRSLVMEIKAAK